MTVAILCASRNSVYHTLPDVEVYDVDRDARSFPGGMPIVAHPPCRSWSKYMRHFAKPQPGERDLALWCCDQLRKCGGVLEQPAGSLLFEAAGLHDAGDVWITTVYQSWWGHQVKKATWLAFCGVDPVTVDVPLVLRNTIGDNHRWLWNKPMRSATPPQFAAWLVHQARKADR